MEEGEWGVRGVGGVVLVRVCELSVVYKCHGFSSALAFCGSGLLVLRTNIVAVY